MVLAIILPAGGFILGGPMGFAVAAVVVTIFKIIGAIGSSISSATKHRVHKRNHTKCPICAEEVKVEALVCKHCGNELNFTIKDEIDTDDRDKH